MLRNIYIIVISAFILDCRVYGEEEQFNIALCFEDVDNFALYPGQKKNQVAYTCGPKFGVFDLDKEETLFENVLDMDVFRVMAITENRYIVGSQRSARMFQDNSF